MFNRTEQEIIKKWGINNDKPQVSICCITFNHGEYIAQAIDSFLMQETDFPFEIVIGEDCSNDNTKAIIEDYVSCFPSIIKMITSRNNVGVMNNFRRTLKACNGEYIALCDGDDYWTDPHKLQIQKNFLEKDMKYVMSYHDSEAFNENGIINNFYSGDAGARRDLSSIELRQATQIYTLTVMFRNVLSELPPEITFSQIGDLFLWVLLSEYGQGKFLANISAARYRVHQGGVMSMSSIDRKIFMGFTLNAALVAYFNRNNDAEYRRFFLNRILVDVFRLMGIGGLIKAIINLFFGKYLKLNGNRRVNHDNN